MELYRENRERYTILCDSDRYDTPKMSEAMPVKINNLCESLTDPLKLHSFLPVVKKQVFRPTEENRVLSDKSGII